MCASRPRPRLPFARLLFTCACVAIVNSQEDTCETPSGKAGLCVNIKLCPYIVDNLYNKVTVELKQYINSSVCAPSDSGLPQSERRICCDRPSCATDDGQAGACVEPQICRTQNQKSKGTCILGDSICCPRRTRDGYVSRITGLPEYGFCGQVADKTVKATRDVSASGQSPWSALLVYRESGSETEKCGGALISARAVLTAAHCVEILPVKIRLGVHNLNEQCTDVRGGCPFVSDIDGVVVAPSYDKITGKDDIAIVTMATPAPYIEHIRPICLPASNYDTQYLISQVTETQTAGWGVSQDLTGNELVGAENVQTIAALPTRKESVCLGAMSRWAELLSPYETLNVTLPENSLCAGGTFDTELCAQDSGGPLAYSLGDQIVLLAVHSKFIAGCRAPVPAVYTSAAAHVKWIGEYMAGYYNRNNARSLA